MAVNTTESPRFLAEERPSGAIDIHDNMVDNSESYLSASSAFSQLRTSRVLAAGLSTGLFSVAFYTGVAAARDLFGGLKNESFPRTLKGAAELVISYKTHTAGEFCRLVEDVLKEKIEAVANRHR